MVRGFTAACILLLLFPVQLLTAQDEPTHSIAEISAFLKKSKAGPERAGLLLEAALIYMMKPGAERNDMDSALFFITAAMNLSNRLNEPALQARCYRVYSRFYQRYYNINADSERVVRMKYAEQTERLYEQNKQLSQTRIVRNMTFGLIALLLVIVGLLLNGYRFKQRRNKKLQLQQQEITDKNTSLRNVIYQKERLLVEKEWLLKEVHHRVKNNMQIVMSLLNTQSAYLENDAFTAIKESHHRMQAMSLIHQKLYQEDNVASINMPSYINELAGYLRESYDRGRHIHYNLDIEEVELDVSQAVPVGLILNEVITNVIKYAFLYEHDGTIDIVMKRSVSWILLNISDNGIGLPSGYDPGKKHSFGMNLIRGLVSQLEGTLSVVSHKGLHIQIEFPSKMVVKAAAKNEVLTVL